MDVESQFLNDMNTNFYTQCTSSMDPGRQIHIGQPYGGLGVRWRKSLGTLCSIVRFNDTRLLGVELSIDGKLVILLNVYMPYECADNDSTFMDYPSKIRNIVNYYNTPYVYIINISVNAQSMVYPQFGIHLRKF